MKAEKGTILGIVVLVGMLMAVGCANKAQTGALTGAALGAGVGAAVGDGEGAAIGAAAGGIGGYMVGNEMDKSDAAAERQANYEAANTHVVYVTNSNGSTTPVTLRRYGGRWVGPRGEEYSSIPSEQQLRAIYGF